MTTKTYYQAQARYWRRKAKRAEHDVADMHESHCTSFDRCSNCKHLHDSVIICPFCGLDEGTGMFHRS